MKISKRTLIMVLAMVLALSVTAFGTVAYMTDRETATNIFTIGSIDITVDETDVDKDTPKDPDEDDDGKPEVDLDGDGEPDIEIDVTPDGDIVIDPTPDNPNDPENDIVIDPDNIPEDGPVTDNDGDGNPEVDLDNDGDPDIEIEIGDDEIIITPIDPEGNPTDDPIVVDPTPDEPSDPDRVQENEYKLIPGLPQTKDPRVTVEAGSEECYVRMRVVMTCHSVMSDITGKDGIDLLDEFVDINNGWLFQPDAVVVDTAADTITLDFWYKQEGAEDSIKVDASAAKQILPTLFDTFTTPRYFEHDDLESLGNNFVMTVEGHAIQTASFTNDVQAWEAFDNQIFGDDMNQE